MHFDADCINRSNLRAVFMFIASGENSTDYNFGYTSEGLPMAVFWISILRSGGRYENYHQHFLPYLPCGICLGRFVGAGTGD
jgi:hypothetical protein